MSPTRIELGKGTQISVTTSRGVFIEDAEGKITRTEAGKTKVFYSTKELIIEDASGETIITEFPSKSFEIRKRRTAEPHPISDDVTISVNAKNYGLFQEGKKTAGVSGTVNFKAGKLQSPIEIHHGRNEPTIVSWLEEWPRKK